MAGMDARNKRALIAALRQEIPMLAACVAVFVPVMHVLCRQPFFQPLLSEAEPADAGQRLWALGILFVLALSTRPLVELAWALAKRLKGRVVEERCQRSRTT